jgi:hypothetical protein
MLQPNIWKRVLVIAHLNIGCSNVELHTKLNTTNEDREETITVKNKGEKK